MASLVVIISADHVKIITDYLSGQQRRDRGERFINHRDNPDEIRAAEQRLTQTNSHSTSATDFDHYVSIRGETMNVLGPLYENAIFRKIRWQTSIGKQRDFSLLGNLIRRKFGSDRPPSDHYGR